MNKPSDIALNRNVLHNYLIMEEFEAGLALLGWEVRSLRTGGVSIRDSYVILKGGEAFLFGASFVLLTSSFKDHLYEPKRIRKLLLNKYELNLLYGRVNRRGYTLVALSLYWKNTWCKIKIGLVKGKKQYEKRSSLKENEWKRDKVRIMKNRNIMPQ